MATGISFWVHPQVKITNFRHHSVRNTFVFWPRLLKAIIGGRSVMYSLFLAMSTYQARGFCVIGWVQGMSYTYTKAQAMSYTYTKAQAVCMNTFDGRKLNVCESARKEKGGSKNCVIGMWPFSICSPTSYYYFSLPLLLPLLPLLPTTFFEGHKLI